MTYSRKIKPIYSTQSAVERLALRFSRCMGSHSKHLGALYLFASKHCAFYALTRSLPAASRRRCRGPFFLQVSGSQNLGVSTQTFGCQRLWALWKNIAPFLRNFLSFSSFPFSYLSFFLSVCDSMTTRVQKRLSLSHGIVTHSLKRSNPHPRRV